MGYQEFSLLSPAPVASPVNANPAPYKVEPSDPALHGYLHGLFGHRASERLHVIYCDPGRHYLFDETLAQGCVDRIVARARPLFERAFQLGAGGMLLAHNHPSGDCRPSDSDIRSTRHLRDIGRALEIELFDHLIFAPGRCFSMASGGYL